MITPEWLYSTSNAFAFMSWLILMIAPHARRVRQILTFGVVGTLALTYVFLLFTIFDPNAFADFSTLPGLMAMFQSPWAVAMGWLHYLAFDMLVGLRIARDSGQVGMHPFALIPFLLGSFLAGPFGWCAYMVFRKIRVREEWMEW
ncbi:MAG: ABA4-like family protein [Flavobacteriales bacterium]